MLWLFVIAQLLSIFHTHATDLPPQEAPPPRTISLLRTSQKSTIPIGSQYNYRFCHVNNRLEISCPNFETIRCVQRFNTNGRYCTPGEMVYFVTTQLSESSDTEISSSED